MWSLGEANSAFTYFAILAKTFDFFKAVIVMMPLPRIETSVYVMICVTNITMKILNMVENR